MFKYYLLVYFIILEFLFNKFLMQAVIKPMTMKDSARGRPMVFIVCVCERERT